MRTAHTTNVSPLSGLKGGLSNAPIGLNSDISEPYVWGAGLIAPRHACHAYPPPHVSISPKEELSSFKGSIVTCTRGRANTSHA